MARQQIAKIQKSARRSSDPPLAKQSKDASVPAQPIIALQHTIGNQAVQRLLQAKLKVNELGDQFEQEADRSAEAVMRAPMNTEAVSPSLSIGHIPDGSTQRMEEEDRHAVQRDSRSPLKQHPEPGDELEQSCSSPMQCLKSGQQAGIRSKGGDISAASLDLETPLNDNGKGSPLPADVQAFMEPQFGADFSHVRAHTGNASAQMNRALRATAFTHQQNIYFGEGKAPGKDALTAHELTHVLQQTGGSDAMQPVRRADVPSVQRVVELRPPGRGEASAFDRRQEIIDRLNALSTAIRYRLEAASPAPRERIVYDVLDEGGLTHFDRQMRNFIDLADVVPLRLINGAGRVDNGSGGFDPLLFDSFIAAYVDVDDLLASDDNAFQMVLLHFLAERSSTRNYARRIGTDMSASFGRAHSAGRQAETAFIQDLIGDPTIRFNYEEMRPNGTLVVAWRSDEGYRVFHIIRRAAAEVRGGEVSVETIDGRRLSVEDFIAERAAAAGP